MSSTRNSRRILDWAYALVVAGRHQSELTGVRGFSLMPLCTRPGHHDICSCSRGTVRYFYTNHHKPTTSRRFEAMRDALGAVPHSRRGDIEAIA